MAEKKAAVQKPEEKPIKFLDKDAVMVVKTDGTVSVKMRKDPYFELVEKAGASKEVLNAASDAIQKVTTDAVSAAADLCVKNKGATVLVNLGGTGPFTQEIKFIGKKEINCRNPSTGEQIHRTNYGVVEATLNMPWGKIMKGEDGELAKHAKRLEDFFNKKK